MATSTAGRGKVFPQLDDDKRSLVFSTKFDHFAKNWTPWPRRYTILAYAVRDLGDAAPLEDGDVQ